MACKANYLYVFNIISRDAWLIMLVLTLLQTGGLFQLKVFYSYAVCCQFIMLMDIVHAALGLVSTSILSTLLQVASRIFIVVLIIPFKN